MLSRVPLQQPFLPATSTAELRFGSVHALPAWATISRGKLKTVAHMQVLAFALQIAAVRVLARPQNPVKALTLNIFAKRGGATKPSLSLRGAGSPMKGARSHACRAAVAWAAAPSAPTAAAARPQAVTCLRPRLAAHNNAIKKRGGQLPLLILRCGDLPDS